ncbi:GFA family protein [Shinella curvata]|uniref:GFA family protein n=1 Tax=Shinella curvata TaxID=1817964 RepID=A0ABT8XDZ8_9HYPH|nr:GFA family protein [Shinella curvata]MCJ8055504.1 GFA family protein [Shinella curvata]MDO6121921.1 GFA family protein [Shinella curvata]
MTRVSGTCLCGRIAVSVRGEPLRVGLCHCMDCRKESGSAFTYYGVWPADTFECTGEPSAFRGQRFCSHCGARVFSLEGDEAEIKLGILSLAPTGLVPSYELWVRRREPWLRAIEGAAQYDENRT